MKFILRFNKNLIKQLFLLEGSLLTFLAGLFMFMVYENWKLTFLVSGAVAAVYGVVVYLVYFRFCQMLERLQRQQWWYSETYEKEEDNNDDDK